MTEPARFLDFGVFSFDVIDRLLLRSGEAVALTPKALDTLWVLLERRPGVVSKQDLIEAVWPQAFVTEATLTQNIYTLRKALDVGDGQRWIQTVARRGYRFEGPVTEVVASARKRRGAEGQDGPEVEQGTISSASDLVAIRSLAVLPLQSFSVTGGDEFLGLGLADAVITSLSNVRQLTVRATSSILRYVDATDLDPVATGRDLAVDGVLEGTVQRHGDHIRVTLQLISVARGVPCWAESFQGAFEDLFAAQDAISRELVARLQVTLSQQEKTNLGQRPARSLEAYRTYVRGRYFWNRRTAADLQRSIELFRQAVAQDPDYAAAYSGLADALILLPFYGTARPIDCFRQARDASLRALALDDHLAEAHTSLAYTEFVYSHDWPVAEESFRRAMDCSSSYPTARHWYGFLLSALGRHEEAIRLLTLAHDLEPLSLVISTDLAMANYFARQIDEAINQLASVLEVAPHFGYAHFGLALCLSEVGNHRGAIEAASRAAELLTDSAAVRATLGCVLARGGRQQEARKVLSWLQGEKTGRFAQSSHRALVLVGLGDVEAALQELLQGSRERSRFLVFLGVWPAFDGLRSDCRFRGLLEGLGLWHGEA
ncbi:MAG: winged helix-turn-helix domain-containing protein [Deltaproteobacteria bacterium]|nr:winged helix-turn-helix domain-containing protein [Deltaproteobacteria bacterium]